jgi:hypothetical protein
VVNKQLLIAEEKIFLGKKEWVINDW